MPADTGTRWTASANQPNTRDHPKERTTAAAEGNGQGPKEEPPTTKQSYKKREHPQRPPTPKKASPDPKKAAPGGKKNSAQSAENQQQNRQQTETSTDREHTPYLLKNSRRKGLSVGVAAVFGFVC